MPFPTSTPEAEGVPAQALVSLRDRIDGWVEADRLVGAELLIIRNQRTLLHEAFGWKDREAGKRMEPNTLFNIRSMTKPLIGALARSLMEDGLLSPDDPVGHFLPAFREGGCEAITVGQLLTHFGGLPANRSWEPKHPPASLRAYATTIGEAGPELEPGSRFWYSDAGADVLGAVLEVATGESLDRVLVSRVLKPLGMKNTGYLRAQSTGGETTPRPGAGVEDFLRDLPISRVSALYGGSRGQWQRFWVPGEESLYPFPLGSQGVYSTPLDYARFLSVWLGWESPGRHILSGESVAAILDPVAPMTVPGTASPVATALPGLEVWHGEMSMLWREEEAGPIRVVGYSGSDGTFAWAWPDEGLMVFLFSQSRGLDVQMEVEEMLPSLLGEGSERDTQGFEPYLGRYGTDSGPYAGQTFTVLVQDERLAIDIPGQTVFTLRAPDPKGWRPFTLTDQAAVRFQEEGAVGRTGAGSGVSGLELAQVSSFPRHAIPDTLPPGIPQELSPLLGDYLLPGGQGSLTVTWSEGALIVVAPGGGRMTLSHSVTGTWTTQGEPPKEFTFQRDASGTISSLNLREAVVLPRIPG